MWQPPRLALAFGVAVGLVGFPVGGRFISEALNDLAALALAGALVLMLAAPDDARGNAGARVRARLVTLARSHAWIVLLMLPGVFVVTFTLGTRLATAWALTVAGPVLFLHAGLHATDAALAAVWSASTRVRRGCLALLHVVLFFSAIVTPPLLQFTNPYALGVRAMDAVSHGGAFPVFALALGFLASVACFALPRRAHVTEAAG